MRFHCNYLSKRLLLQQNIISGAFRLINQGLIFMFLLVALRYVTTSIKMSHCPFIWKNNSCVAINEQRFERGTLTWCVIARPVSYSFAHYSFQGQPSVRRGVYDQMASAMNFPQILGTKLKRYACHIYVQPPHFNHDLLFIFIFKNGCEEMSRT